MQLLDVQVGEPFDMARNILTALGHTQSSSATNPSAAFDILCPKTTSTASPNTLSSRFGLGVFPLHTECAHWPVPPRYLVLCCLNPGGRADTSILDLSTLLSDLKREAGRIPLLCNRGRRSLHVTLYDRSTDGWRYDTSCLVPVTNEGRELLQEVAVRVSSGVRQTVRWTPGRVAVIDNWREAHGRHDAVCTSGRRLLRMVIK